jgi:AraC-like DNA-binding protein
MKAFVKKWLNKYQKYFFTYRDGFFELPFLANSPELMVESFGNMPFVKHYPEKSYFTTNNIFLNGDGHYQKIEEGLWIIISNIKLKRNLSFKLYYEEDQPSNYHFLTLYVNQDKRSVKSPKIQFEIDFQDRAWTLYKANSECINSHFAGQQSIYFSIYFSQNWLQHNMAQNGIFNNENLEFFFMSNHEYLYMPNLLQEKHALYEKIIEKILDKVYNENKDVLELKSLTYELLNSFVKTAGKKDYNLISQDLSEKDKRLVFKAQHILDQKLFEKFPSISYIAKSIGISETKLKADFKKIHGTSIFQFYSMKQMLYAKEMLKRDNITIKEIAMTLGYSNQGKFSLAFKRFHGVLPSEFIK